MLDPSYQIIDICLPTDLHAEVAVAALEASKHVFCEKPMALSAPDCNRMQTAAEAHRRVLMIGHVLRFWPEYLVLADFVAGGSMEQSVQLFSSVGAAYRTGAGGLPEKRVAEAPSSIC